MKKAVEDEKNKNTIKVGSAVNFLTALYISL